VYLVPLGTRYELYCEVPDTSDHHEVPEAESGVFRRLYHRFRHVLATVQDERRTKKLAAASAKKKGFSGWIARLRDRMIRWIAESIAEQRLLWHLRGEDGALLHHPDDLDGARAIEIARQFLKRDADRHLFWLIVDGIILILTGVGAIIPGPNLLAYYFTFRSVGHFLSWRGARNGLVGIQWETSSSAPLTALRDVPSMTPPVRAARVREVAGHLRLERLAAFVERTAVRSA